MTVLAITDELQSLELTAKGAFPDNPLGGAQTFITDKLGGTQLSPDAGDITSSLDAAADQASLTGANALPTPPIGITDVQTQVTGRLDSLTSLNLDTLTQAIPATPGVDTFKNLDVTTAVNQAVTSLGSAITGSENFGDLKVASSDSPILAEFDAFLRNAQAFPARLLDTLLTTFKTLLDKLAHPEDWLESLSSEALTEIFQEQIQAVTGSMTPVAIRQGAAAIQLRGQQALTLTEVLNGLDFDSLNRESIKSLRQQVKAMGGQLEGSDRTLKQVLQRLTDFDLKTFTTLLKELPSSGGGEIEAIANLFNQAETFVDGLNGRISQVTDQLNTLITQVQDFLQQILEKIDQVADTVVSAIQTQLDTAKDALAKVREYIQQAIQTIRDFVDQAVTQVQDLVKPVKQAFNQVSTTAVGGIDTLATTIKEQTEILANGVREVGDTLDQHLNKEAMKAQIQQVLGQVTKILESPSVTNAIAQAEQGIDQVVAALQQISLDPAFDLAVTKTKALETDLRGIDTSTMGTAQKTALKVGVAILEQVDVPGIVTPELTEAFDDVLNPVVNIVDLMHAEVKQVTDQVQVFEPGTLLQNALQPFIDQFVATIRNYRPSVLLQPVKDIYNTLLDKLEVLNPDQLLALLDDLYQKLLNVLEALSPEGLTNFLNTQLETIATKLETLPVKDLVQRVMDAIGDVESLVNGLGLDEVLNSKFWQTLTEILSINLQAQIDQVDSIKAEIVGRINQMDEAKLREELDILRAAVNTFANDPTADCNQAATALGEAWEEHQQAIITLQAAWDKAQAPLTEFDPAPDFAFDYQDLRERLTALHQRLTPTTELPDYTALKSFTDTATGSTRSDEAKRLRPTKTAFKQEKTVTTLSDRTDDDIIQAFQAVIPDELEQQFFGPTRRILQKLDETLALPRQVLSGIETVIQQLADAPRHIADSLRDLAFGLGDQLRQAITAVVTTIRSFDFDFINDLHRQIVDQIAALRPSYLINGFHDASDFTDGSLAKLLATLRTQDSEDAVSRYLLNQFDENQRNKVLGSDGAATDALVIAMLNRVLNDKDLYSDERFSDVELPQEAIELRDRPIALDSQDQVRFNRLLLETYYRDAMVLSLQSLFPYFLDKLRSLYPDDLVQELDQVFDTIISAIKTLPEALAEAINEEYNKVKAVFKRVIEDPIEQLFKALIGRLRGLQSELGIGLEDISDAYNRLLAAVPV